MTDYLLFATAFMASALAPGADTFLIATRALESRVGAIWAATGIALAKLSMVTIVFFGLNATIQNASWLISILQVLGVGFLLFRAWVLWNKLPGTSSAKVSGRDFVTGFTIGFSNPQPLIFYLSVMPAVVGGTEIWALWLIVSLGFALVSASYILATIPLRTWLKAGKNEVAVNRVVSIVFVLLALWIALR